MDKDKQAREVKEVKQATVFSNNMEQLRYLKKSIDSIKRKKMLLYDQCCDVLIPKSAYMEQRNNCDIQLRELEEQTTALEKETRIDGTLHESPALSLLRGVDLAAGLTHELIEGLVDRILVYDDTRIEIVWQFTGYPFEDIARQKKEVLHETA